jgi:hypothetical protein
VIGHKPMRRCPSRVAGAKTVFWWPMKNLKKYWLAGLCSAFLFAVSAVQAADAKSYQVTGPVLEISATTITVQKGEEKWQLARNNNTKIKGDLKLGSKVTIYYTMVADEVEVKDVKSEGKKKGKEGKKE